VSPTTIQEIEAGRRNVCVGKIEIIAIGLGLTGVQLLARAIGLKNEPINEEKDE
jgi:transcriptional regulator with XRE-family HTH domain